MREAQRLFAFLAKGHSVAEARRAILFEDLLEKRTYETRRRCWTALSARYLSPPGNPAVTAITNLVRACVPETVLSGVLYYHYTLSDLFTYETTVDCLFPLAMSGRETIAPRDIDCFLSGREAVHPEIRRWSPQTRKTLVSRYLSALRDFGILEGRAKKTIRKPFVPLELLLYMVYFLRDEGESGRGIVKSRDFRLFLLTPDEVAASLTRAAAQGYLRFERTGDMCILELPLRSVYEYTEKLRQKVH